MNDFMSNIKNEMQMILSRNILIIKTNSRRINSIDVIRSSTPPLSLRMGGQLFSITNENMSNITIQINIDGHTPNKYK